MVILQRASNPVILTVHVCALLVKCGKTHWFNPIYLFYSQHWITWNRNRCPISWLYIYMYNYLNRSKSVVVYWSCWMRFPALRPNFFYKYQTPRWTMTFSFVQLLGFLLHIKFSNNIFSSLQNIIPVYTPQKCLRNIIVNLQQNCTWNDTNRKFHNFFWEAYSLYKIIRGSMIPSHVIHNREFRIGPAVTHIRSNSPPIPRTEASSIYGIQYYQQNNTGDT